MLVRSAIAALHRRLRYAAILIGAFIAPAVAQQIAIPPGFTLTAVATGTISATTTSSKLSLSSVPFVWVTNQGINPACLAFGANPTAIYPCGGTSYVGAGQSTLLPVIGAANLAGVTGTGTTTLAVVEGYAAPLSSGNPSYGKISVDQTTPGSTNGVNIDPTSASTAAITPQSALNVTSLVLKNAPGNFWSGYAINRTATAGFIVVYNATAAPAPGALTAGLVLACVPLPANGAGAINNKPGPPQEYSAGIVVLVTSASNCAAYTTGTITADVFGDAS